MYSEKLMDFFAKLITFIPTQLVKLRPHQFNCFTDQWGQNIGPEVGGRKENLISQSNIKF